MPDILLIQPPIRDFYLTAKRTFPYGLACIASALEGAGFSVGILDALATGRVRRIELPPEMSYLREYYPGPDISPFALFHDYRHYGLGFEKIGKMAADSGAFLIGISSLFTAYSDEAILAAESVRRYCPGAVIVLGGHHPTEMPEEVLKHECVDFVIRGEGEAALPLLARAVRSGASPEEAPGVAFRRSFPALLNTEGKDGAGPGVVGQGCLHISPPAVMKSLDESPGPALRLVDMKFYRRRKASAVVVAGRGCPLNCSYCSIGGAPWSRFRLKSLEAVREELDRAVFDEGVRFIDFEDENISFDRKWFMSLLQSVATAYAGLGVEFRAMNGLFPPTLDDEVIGAMKEAGFTALNLSLCTTSPEQLARFRRPDVSKSFDCVLESAKKHGMETIGYIIAGAPGQTARDSISDLAYLAARKVLAGVSIFYPAPGSSDFERCQEDGLLPGKFSLMRSTALPISDTMTRLESATTLRLGRILNFMKSLRAEELNEVLEECRQDSVLIFKKIEEIREAGINREACRSGGYMHAPVAAARDGDYRRSAGRLLLALFLRDGIIRGISPRGATIDLPASPDLCLLFRAKILDLLKENGFVPQS